MLFGYSATIVVCIQRKIKIESMEEFSEAKTYKSKPELKPRPNDRNMPTQHTAI